MVQLRELSLGNWNLKTISQAQELSPNFRCSTYEKGLTKLLTKKDHNFIVPERKLEKGLSYYKLRVIFRSKCRLNTLFQFKHSLEKTIRSGVIYRYTCSTARLLIKEKPCTTFSTKFFFFWCICVHDLHWC